MSAVFGVALPFFAVIGAGFLAMRLRLAPAGDVAALNRFVFRFAMPVAVFGFTAQAKPPSGDDLIVAAVYGGVALSLMVVVYAAARPLFSLSGPEAGAHALSSILANAVFVGLPIALAIDGWGPHFLVLMLVEGIGVITLGAALIAPGRKTFLALIAAPFRNPLVVGLISGLMVSLLVAGSGLSLPLPLTAFVNILGSGAGPTALFALGLFLGAPTLSAHGADNGGAQQQAAAQRSPSYAARILAIAVVKLVALPALFLSGIYLAGIHDPAFLGPAALFAFLPAGVGSFVMAEAYGTYRRETASAIAFTTILSTATIAAVLFVFVK